MRRLIRILMVAIAAVASAVAYSGLPERVAMHWNIRGEPDRYGSPMEALFVIPLIMLAVWGLLRVLPKIDPFRDNYAKFAGTYELVIDLVLGMMLVMHIAVLLGALGAPQTVATIARAGMGVMFIILGNIMPRTRQNWFVGIRTPWTLSSARVWEKTHRVGGYGFVALGFLVLLTIPFAPQVGIPVLVAGLVAVGVGSVVYSFFVWRAERA
jgi:uncharacterized membrane protein